MVPLLAVDTIIERKGKIVVVKRKKDPFKNMLALPGGFVKLGETVENAAIREAKEETSLDVELKAILGVYSDPKRDPRGQVISIVFIAKPVGGELKSGSDAKEASWMSLKDIKSQKFAFDHEKIIQDYLKWKRKGKTYWSSKK